MVINARRGVAPTPKSLTSSKPVLLSSCCSAPDPAATLSGYKEKLKNLYIQRGERGELKICAKSWENSTAWQVGAKTKCECECECNPNFK